MNVQDLQTMLDYHYWARDRVLEAVDTLSSDQYNRDLGNSFKSVRDTLTHIYAAEWAWYERWQGRVVTALVSSDRFADLASLKSAWAEHETKMRAFVNAIGDVNRVIEYKLLSGAPGASPIWQMVQHVVNHASYHRGQITTMLRQLGVKPPQSLDMIAYYRGLEARG
ncbi:MAG TPA: DinB family protein [Vicinamibacterales bacterium]|nr:DinB family protein [Vicinamibacterales bacterium]